MKFSFPLLLLACLPFSVSAEIVSFNSVIDVIDPPPPSVRLNDLESNTQIRVFQEQSNYEVTSPFIISGTGPRLFDSFGDYQDQLLPVGTRFDSYFVHVDTLGSSSAILGIGELTFSTPIIGIVGRDPHIFETNPIVGAPGTLYPLTRDSQHFDFNNNDDFFDLLGDGRTVRIQAEAGAKQDQFRILVAPAVPEPTSFSLLGFAMMVTLFIRNRASR